MTLEIIEEITFSAKAAIVQHEQELNGERVQQAKLLPLLPQLSDNVTIAWGGGRTWITVTNREDLAILFTLGSRWEKEVSGDAIVYTNGGYPGPYFRISARDEALPPTCRVVKEVKIEPARPAQEYTVTTIKCDL